MNHPARDPSAQHHDHDPSTAELVGRLSEQVGRLAREEISLAVAEVKTKGRNVGVGAGLLGGAGVLAWFGVMALIAGLVLVLALVMPAWLAAFVVAVAVFAVAGVLALIGRKRIDRGTPPIPEQAVSGVQRDISQVKERAHR
ncbi:phage holin family protein [Saccharothrix australiensis]|uniref:Putative membrane protein YqjE n=1 Tax=Saccharothrix australiensis TaxID=2072 RepID=A0A495VX39_9PSEU|nr:phage holin family protein [Saccharothrix australiensis]RKT53991.1 putative membrane protein YqjE [Saccharothrix australiensis]